MFKWAIAIHMLMSYVMFGLSTIFSIQNVSGNNLEPIDLEMDMV